MDRAADVPAREQPECVAGVDGQRAVLGAHPFPLARRMVSDLQSRDGLAEEQRERAQVGVSAAPQPEPRVLLGRKLAVFHVPQVILYVN